MSDSTKSEDKRKSVFAKFTSAIKNVFGVEDNVGSNFEISKPYNFKHTTHVQADPHSSTGFSVIRNSYELYNMYYII